MYRRMYQTLFAFLTLTLPTLAYGSEAASDERLGQPTPGAIDLQLAASPVKHMMHDFHNDYLLPIIAGITIFVMILMLWVMIRYNKWTNPKPSRTTHNTWLEVVWTAVPIIILIVIAVPSLKLLYYSERTPQTEMTLKAIGHQWYWEYKYPDHGDITLNSYMKADKDRKEGEPRLLATDVNVVLPTNTPIKVDVTAADVIHSWAIPAFGVKKDAVPGRLNTTWMTIEKEGIYYGQCSELCGTDHAYMPIAIEAVSPEKFAEWIAKTQKEQGITPPAAEATEAAKPAQAQAAAPAATH